MNNQSAAFWASFNDQNFGQALEAFNCLSDDEKSSILAELFQKSGYHQKPAMVSVLRRVIQEGQTFHDFHQAWLPDKAMCNTTETRGQVFQQHFPIPVRVMNARNINNPNEIMSIGITWVKDESEEQALWAHLEHASEGKNADNETRHERIDQVADGGLLGLFTVESDDNLGTPF